LPQQPQHTEETKEKIKQSSIGLKKSNSPRGPIQEETKEKLRGPRGPQKNPRIKRIL